MTETLGAALRRARAQISTIQGSSEFAAVANNDGLRELFQQIQDLKTEMNDKKREAAAEAALPYLEAIASLESNYALWLKMSS